MSEELLEFLWYLLAWKAILFVEPLEFLCIYVLICDGKEGSV